MQMGPSMSVMEGIQERGRPGFSMEQRTGRR